MATQAEWYAKLKSFVPAWFFEKEIINVAEFEGIAAELAEIEQVARDHQRETFIKQADDGYLDELGIERSVARLPGELDPSYAPRVQLISNTTPVGKLTELVNGLLAVGTCTIIEDETGGIFLSRASFFGDHEVMIDPIYNVFSIIVTKQVHAPYSFISRGTFMNRSNFIGTILSPQSVFDAIVAAVNKNKALGTLYRVIELTE